MPQLDAPLNERLLEGEGAAEHESDEIAAPMAADVGRLVDELAVAEHTVARQIGADVEVVGKRRQAKIAGRRSREQRARLGIELAEAQEVAGDVAGQNGEIALHVTRSDAGGLALETACAGSEPRVAAGLREERRSASRHGGFLLARSSWGRAENAGTGCLSYHQRAHGARARPPLACLK